MASGGHNKKRASQKAMQGTLDATKLLQDSASRERIGYLLDEWMKVARIAVEELQSETSVTIVNAGDQVQKHPAVTVLEAASKQLQSLTMLAEQFVEPEDDAGGFDGKPELYRAS
jgi:phage terminase small subunit